MSAPPKCHPQKSCRGAYHRRGPPDCPRVIAVGVLATIAAIDPSAAHKGSAAMRKMAGN